MNPKSVLRLEGLAVFAAATAAYFLLGAPLWLFVVLALAPDIAMLGYLAGSDFGSGLYNAFHTYLGPLPLAGVGVLVGPSSIVWVALIWAAHIGMDRAVGYGLKYPSGFKDTHLMADVDARGSVPHPDTHEAGPVPADD
jgi:hypothetical protein